MSKLTGSDLDKKVKALIAKGYGLSATAIECGYFSNGPNDTKIPATTPFTRELLKAAGYEFAGGARGSAMGDTVKVMSTGTVVLAPSRVKTANLEPGDELKIVFNPTTNSFVLDKIESEPEPTSEPSSDQPSLMADW